MGKNYFLGQLNTYLWFEKSQPIHGLSNILDLKPNLVLRFFFQN